MSTSALRSPALLLSYPTIYNITSLTNILISTIKQQQQQQHNNNNNNNAGTQ